MYDDKGEYSVPLDQEKKGWYMGKSKYGRPVAVVLHTRLLGTASVICTVLPAIYLCHELFTWSMGFCPTILGSPVSAEDIRSSE